MGLDRVKSGQNKIKHEIRTVARKSLIMIYEVLSMGRDLTDF